MIETRWQRQKRVERWTGERSADLDAEELERARIAGHEPGQDGYMTGRDPRQMKVAELEAMGHQRMSAQEALRLKCLDCCVGSAHEVRHCVAVTCPVLAVPHGQEPWWPPPSGARLEAMRAAGRCLARKIDSGAAEPDETRALDEEEGDKSPVASGTAAATPSEGAITTPTDRLFRRRTAPRPRQEVLQILKPPGRVVVGRQGNLPVVIADRPAVRLLDEANDRRGVNKACGCCAQEGHWVPRISGSAAEGSYELPVRNPQASE